MFYILSTSTAAVFTKIREANALKCKQSQLHVWPYLASVIDEQMTKPKHKAFKKALDAMVKAALLTTEYSYMLKDNKICAV